MRSSILHAATAAALSLASLLAPAAAQAHGAWLAKIHGEYTVMFGHEESDTDAYDPAKVVDARALKNGTKVEVRVVPQLQRYATLESSAPGLMGFTMDGGFWHKTKEGKWVNKPRSAAERPDEVESAVRGLSYAVSYLNKREAARALGYDLEIVPAVNPARLKQGQKLAVQVLYKGQSLAGVAVSNNFFGDAEKVTTDSEGRAELPVARKGMNALAVSHRPDFEDKSKADKYGLSALLSFESADEGAH